MRLDIYANQIPIEKTTVNTDWNGAVLRTVTKNWILDNLLKSEQVVLENGLTSKTDYDYFNCTLRGYWLAEDCLSPLIEKDEYDWGSGTPGPLLKKTVISYATFAPTPLFPEARSILDRPANVTVYGSNGTTQMARTDYAYDQTAVTPVSYLTSHDDTNYGASYNNRGNLTTKTEWLNIGGTSPSTTYTYDITGQLLSVTNPLGKTTSYSYTDSFTSGGPPAGTVTNAYVTTATYPTTGSTAHVETMSYAYAGGQLTAFTDQNGNTTNYTYADSLGRLTQVSYPDLGQTTYAYNETSYPFSVSKTQLIASGVQYIDVAQIDGLGHVTQTQITSDPAGTNTIKTTYDGMERVWTASNPYRNTTDSTYGITTSTYDALGRVTTIVRPDGSTSSQSYSGNCTSTTDEAGKARQSCADALGRLTQVFEDPLGLNYETDYQYDALGNLIRVDQKGNGEPMANWRTRTFSYNSLSQLKSATTPESGVTTYTYNNDGTLATRTAPKPNQTSPAVMVTTTYTYDDLQRLTGKTYDNGDPSVSYFYDQTSYNGLTIVNGKGRRTGMSDVSGATAWSYDRVGRVLTERRTLSGTTGTTSYTYNLDGSVKSITYPINPFTRVINYEYNTAKQPITLRESSRTFVQDVTYAPHGAIASAYFGYWTGPPLTFLTGTYTYNKRLQPVNITAVNNAGNTLLSLDYNFNLGTADNGNVAQITNNRNSDRTQIFTYDGLNRVATARSQATSGPNCWGQQFSYDTWGNLTSIK